MASLIYQTLIIILLLTFSFGPAFFALINSGIKYGYKPGSALAIGIVISDFLLCLLIIFLVNIGATSLIQDEKNQRFMGILAGLVLVIFGALYFRKPIKKSEEVIELKLPSTATMLFKGFFLNILNPTVWLLWLGNVTAVSKSLNYSVVKMVIYFGITLGLVLLVEVAKMALAGRIKMFLTEQIMQLVNTITGVLLIIFGLVLIYNHYFD